MLENVGLWIDQLDISASLVVRMGLIAICAVLLARASYFRTDGYLYQRARKPRVNLRLFVSEERLLRLGGKITIWACTVALLWVRYRVADIDDRAWWADGLMSLICAVLVGMLFLDEVYSRRLESEDREHPRARRESGRSERLGAP